MNPRRLARFAILLFLICAVGQPFQSHEYSFTVVSDGSGPVKNSFSEIVDNVGNGAQSHRGFHGISDRQTLRWAETFDVGFSKLSDVQQTFDGGYVFAGFAVPDNSYRIAFLLRLDAAGKVIWYKFYRGPDQQESFANSVQDTPDGGFIVAGGYSTILGPRLGFESGWLFKVNRDGEMLWQKSYGALHPQGFQQSSGFLSIEKTLNKKYVVTGWTGAFGLASPKGWILEIDQSGNILWQYAYVSTSPSVGVSLSGRTFPLSDGGFIVTGATTIAIGPQPPFGYPVSALLLKLDSTGKQVWQRAYKVDNPFGYFALAIAESATETPDHGFMIVGMVSNYAFGNNVWVMRTNSKGDLLWQQPYSPQPQCLFESSQSRCSGDAVSIHQLKDGSYIIGTGLPDQDSPALVMKIDSSGRIIWQRSLNSPKSCCPEFSGSNQLQLTSDGGYVLAGYYFVPTTDEQVAWAVKLDSTGFCCNDTFVNATTPIFPTPTMPLITIVPPPLSSITTTATPRLTDATGTTGALTVGMQCSSDERID